jgi:hypothetical protein
VIEEAPTSCVWCDRPFRARQTGGRSQRFCRPFCRRSFHAAVRTWAIDAIANGTLTVAQVKDGVSATRALAPAARVPLPIGEVISHRLAPAAPRADSYRGQRDLEQLMARAIAVRRR